MILDWPLTTRDEIVAAFRLGAEVASDSPLKTLRKHGVVSEGVRVVRRSGGRVAGQRVFYSSLCLDAARLARHGLFHDAQKIALAARALESTQAATAAARETAEEGDSCRALTEFARHTEAASREFRQLLHRFVDRTEGRVAAVSSETVVVVTESNEWTLLRRTLPEELAVPGMSIVLVTEWLGDAGALVCARRGVPSGDAVSPVKRPRLRPLLPLPGADASTLRSALEDAWGSVVAEGVAPSEEVRTALAELSPSELSFDELIESVAARYRAK